MRREFIDVRRDRRSLFLTFLYPISMLIMYGYGIRYDVDNVPLTILDYSETPESRDLIQRADPLRLLPARALRRAPSATSSAT